MGKKEESRKLIQDIRGVASHVMTLHHKHNEPGRVGTQADVFLVASIDSTTQTLRRKITEQYCLMLSEAFGSHQERNAHFFPKTPSFC